MPYGFKESLTKLYLNNIWSDDLSTYGNMLAIIPKLILFPIFFPIVLFTDFVVVLYEEH